MTTYSTISNAAVAVGAIPSSTTVTALRDNPIAIAEAASGAPVMVSGWHPVDKVTIGDGKDGKIYDFATNGVQANVTTANFEDGWEYRLVGLDLLHNSGSPARVQVSAYFQTDAVYRRVFYGLGGGASDPTGFDVEFRMPRVASKGHLIKAGGYLTTNQIPETYVENFYDSTVQKILNARVTFELGSIAGGTIYLFRRRDYASSP
jgi:hypothetical protein